MVSMSVCYPYGRAIACVCNSHDKVVNCFPTLEMEKKREVVGRQGSMANNMAREMKDNHTEILLAATALVATIALFLRYVKLLFSLFFREGFKKQINSGIFH